MLCLASELHATSVAARDGRAGRVFELLVDASTWQCAGIAVALRAVRRRVVVQPRDTVCRGGLPRLAVRLTRAELAARPPAPRLPSLRRQVRRLAGLAVPRPTLAVAIAARTYARSGALVGTRQLRSFRARTRDGT